MSRAPLTQPGDTPPEAKYILLIEDTPALQMVYRSVLTSAGHRVATASTASDGLARFHEIQPNVVLLDLVLPDGDGLDVMQEMLRQRPDTRIIVITANGSISRAVDAMRAGAHEFLVKPFDEQRFLGAVENAANLPRRHDPPAAGPFLGSSSVMGRIHAKIGSAARSMATVFITGESGTGKELCANGVHDLSTRASGPFIALNCGAIPQDLLESEVFGHVKGSFTGAIADKPGAATAADGGTLFLDEICEMAPSLQTKLLRFLQTSMVQPVGAVRPRKVSVRIVCATNRDPLEEVRRGRFREDLYYRLYVVPIHMPPLRDRGDDVIEIANAALARFAEEEGRHFNGFAPEVLALFRRHPWPGNVRQLLNVVRNVVVLHEGGTIGLGMLPETLADGDESFRPTLTPAPAPLMDNPQIDGLVGRTLAQIEQLVIEATIARHGGSVPKAARVLDVSPSTLYRKREGWLRP